jgi:2-polyprenyl-6-methoxyphenol hydroxylase-like FAD-dependent oxidoreductase
MRLLSVMKLSRIVQGASPDLLDAYNSTQRPVAEQVISITDRLTKIATVQGGLRQIRNLCVIALSFIIRRALARRLSLLGYVKEVRA